MKKEDRPDRYLQWHQGRWQYYRRVPKAVSHLDERKIVQIALGTDNVEIARIRRDGYEEADDILWAGLKAGTTSDDPWSRYKKAQSRASAMGITFKTLDQLIAEAPVEELLARISALKGEEGATRQATADAVLGAAPLPPVPVSKALEIFLEKCAGEELTGKSKKQVEDYKKVKQRAVNNFIDLVGDIDMREVTEEHALIFHNWWMKRVTHPDKSKRLSGNSANRDVGNMRKIYREVFKQLGQRDRNNPFDKLTFKDPKRLKETPPPFPTEWIRDQLLNADNYAFVKGKFRKLNPSTLGIFLACIETGCRPSEICNIKPEHIILEHEIPHIIVDFIEGRQIKTETSVRKIPLIGIALKVFERAPEGFPKYHDGENSFSAAMLKHLRRREMLPTDKHVIYSLRHSFEDRLKTAHVDVEIRKLLMGHSIDRSEYGSGGDLALRLELLKRIELPYDPKLLMLLEGRSI